MSAKLVVDREAANWLVAFLGAHAAAGTCDQATADKWCRALTVQPEGDAMPYEPGTIYIDEEMPQAIHNSRVRIGEWWKDPRAIKAMHLEFHGEGCVCIQHTEALSAAARAIGIEVDDG